jgi:hypothetical protein
MRLGLVQQIWRCPVKSMRGERLREAPVNVCGIVHDRRYALLDPATGKIGSAKHPRLWGRLLACLARMADDALHIALPDGRDVLLGRDDVDGALSDLLGRPVRLSATPPDAPEIERYWPDVDGLALRDMVTSGAIGSGAPPGTFFDYAPLHLMTTATLAHLRALNPQGQEDARRFRPNLVIEVPGATSGFVEDEWVGRTLSIGDEVRLRVTSPVPRCVVPTLAQADLAQDIGILRAIAQHNRPPVPALDGARQPCLGIYATVERGGALRVGDLVR